MRKRPGRDQIAKILREFQADLDGRAERSGGHRQGSGPGRPVVPVGRVVRVQGQAERRGGARDGGDRVVPTDGP